MPFQMVLLVERQFAILLDPVEDPTWTLCNKCWQYFEIITFTKYQIDTYKNHENLNTKLKKFSKNQ